jgi:hypothetical protein
LFWSSTPCSRFFSRRSRSPFPLASANRLYALPSLTALRLAYRQIASRAAGRHPTTACYRFAHLSHLLLSRASLHFAHKPCPYTRSCLIGISTSCSLSHSELTAKPASPYYYSEHETDTSHYWLILFMSKKGRKSTVCLCSHGRVSLPLKEWTPGFSALVVCMVLRTYIYLSGSDATYDEEWLCCAWILLSGSDKLANQIPRFGVNS